MMPVVSVGPHLVVAVQLVTQLLADAEVSLLTRLLGQTLQLVDVAVSVVLECKLAVAVELTQSPGLVDSSDDKYCHFDKVNLDDSEKDLKTMKATESKSDCHGKPLIPPTTNIQFTSLFLSFPAPSPVP